MSPPVAAVSSLRAHLLDSLSAIPGSRTFHIHVLVSTARKPGKSLFLYADTRPKCFVQDVLILLSEETARAIENGSTSANTSLSDVSTGPIPRVFVSAIEASVYGFPTSHSTVLYVSKVDGTGQGVYPSPTSTLLHAFLVFYASSQSPLYAPSVRPHHLWIHLFARSQRQYLFPNSADHPNKRPLGDVALCRWWKKVLSDVAKVVETANHQVFGSTTRAGVPEELAHIRLYHILPGQTELEASPLLRDAQCSSIPPQTPWIYSHPYSVHAEAGIPFPSGTTGEIVSQPEGVPPLAYLIPHFEDDPKSRFLDELAATSEEQSIAVPLPTPRKKRQKLRDSSEVNTVASEVIKELELAGRSTNKEEEEVLGDMAIEKSSLKLQLLVPAIIYIPPSSPAREGNVPSSPRPSTPEQIEEAPRSAVFTPRSPGLPTLPSSLLSPHTPRTPSNNRGDLYPPIALQTPPPRVSPQTVHTPRTPRRPKSDLDTISPAEFWERMSFRQECAVGAVTGFFVAIFSRRGTVPQNSTVDPPFIPSHTTPAVAIDAPILFSPGTLPHSVLKRVMSSLLTGVEFSTSERAQKGTHVIEGAIKGLCHGLGDGNSSGGSAANLGGDNGGTHDTTPNIYSLHVYASLSTSNPPLMRKYEDTAGAAAAVNVLGVRRKKKRE